MVAANIKNTQKQKQNLYKVFIETQIEPTKIRYYVKLQQNMPSNLKL